MLRNRIYLAVVSGHFIVDVLNATGAVLLAVLATPLGLSNAQIGTALTIYLLIGSLSQPLFGWLADRMPDRAMQLAALSVLWMAVFYTLVALAPNWSLLLPVFLLAPLGSGLFHPIGAAAAGSVVPERAASATSIFFFCGQIGLAVGPFVAGALAGQFGAPGIIPLSLAALAPAGLLLFAGRAVATPVSKGPAKPRSREVLKIGTLLIVAFVALVAVRSSIQSVYQSFLPKLFSDRGWEPALFGLMAGTFMGAGAIGQVISGVAADRLGMRAVIIWPLLASVPAGLLCLLSPTAPAAFIGCALSGLLVGGQHSVLVVYAQRLLPVKQGFAAGLILGFTFASGAVGTWIVGQLADSAGLQQVMLGVTLLGLPAALLALGLPGRLHKEAPVPSAAAAD
ncbi:MAG: MFS transporter [Oscillochloris sp.]|nr:MFS transporter [Oscillochloris sp.]